MIRHKRWELLQDDAELSVDIRWIPPDDGIEPSLRIAAGRDDELNGEQAWWVQVDPDEFLAIAAEIRKDLATARDAPGKVDPPPVIDPVGPVH